MAPPRPKPARSLAMRNAWMLLAMLPALALHAWRDDGGLARHLLVGVGAALVFEAGALAYRRQPVTPYLREGSARLFALVLVLYLPGLEGWRLLLSLLVGLVLARQAFGGLGRNLFHPAAVALVCAQLAGVPAAEASADASMALCWLAGGVVLCALRVVRWQAPAGLLLGALLGWLIGGFALALFDPRWILAAFFIAADPVTSPEHPRARFLGSACAGFAAALAGKDAALALLPLLLLALNALAPLLDARFAPPRRTANP